MAHKTRGTLIIIGGREERTPDSTILRKVSEHVSKGKDKLVITTVATTEPDLADDYVPVFQALGVKNVDVLDVRNRQDAYNPENLEKLDGATMVLDRKSVV